jgi:phage gp36-like protein
MAYATVQDMIDRFGEQEMIQLTDDDNAAVQAAPVERALEDAQGLVDGYVGRIYRLPLTGCTKPVPTEEEPLATELVAHPLLVRLTCDIARYYLYDNLAPEHEVAGRYKAAEKTLQAIGDGKAGLSCPWGGEPGTLVAGDAPGTGEVLHGFTPRQITDQTLRGFE